MGAAVKGAPLKVIVVINDKADLWILGRKDIQRVEELRGKIVGVGGMRGTQFLMVREVLKHFGIENDTKVLSTGDVRNGFLSLQQGAVDAAALTPPYNVVAKKLGFTLLARTSDMVGPWPTISDVRAKRVKPSFLATTLYGGVRAAASTAPC